MSCKLLIRLPEVLIQTLERGRQGREHRTLRIEPVLILELLKHRLLVFFLFLAFLDLWLLGFGLVGLLESLHEKRSLGKRQKVSNTIMNLHPAFTG